MAGPLLDHRGEIIYPGKVGLRRPPGRLVLDEHFTSGALPSTLTVTSGTGTYYAINNTGGTKPGYRVTTAATTSSQAAIAAPTINTALPGIKQVWWTVEGLFFDSAATKTTVDWTMALFGTGVGGWIGQTGTNDTAAITFNGSTRTSVARSYQITSPAFEATGSRNLSMVYCPPTKEIWIVSDDQVIGWSAAPSGSNWADGVLTPNLTLTTREAVAHWMQFARLSLSIVTQ